MSTANTAVATAQLSASHSAGPQMSHRPQTVRSIPSDFFWSYTEEPHRTRRQAIIKAHPEVVPHCLQSGLVIDEILQPYHLTHHKSLGVDGLDTDLPTSLEAFFLDSVLGKAFFCTFQIIFYALRPMMVYKLPFTSLHLFNVATQLAFNLLLVHYLGAGALAYLLTSSFLAGSLHPCAGHFIAEHYIFEKQPLSARTPSDLVAVPETYSYYGPLNALTYNVGLHNEHHDFPAIPWTRLSKLHEIAKEFYVDLPHHKSWISVIWQFIWDQEVGLWCRVKRRNSSKTEKLADRSLGSSRASVP
ncbi:MAG: hypothetical protein LQ348_000452 [Seirophora lacunosa]|nr:MAG: hypothetical protein LQ348_000452 [Seirophora lacunosa]